MTARHWMDEPFVVFDTESTGVDTANDRIVTATIATIEGAAVGPITWLVDPGVEIPEQASAIHGVTTERARTEGRPAAEAVREIALALQGMFADGIPVVAFNACFDLSLVEAECSRHGLPTLTERGPIRRVIDPFVIDRAIDKYRSGSRKLQAVCDHYGVKLDSAHDSTADAVAAARVMWMICRRFPEVMACTPDELHERSIGWHRAWAAGFEAHLKRQGKAEQIDGSWPLRSLTLDSVAS